jgi:hypothetical protein
MIVLMALCVSCSRPTVNYQATIVSQQGTMIVMMQSATPSRTPTPTVASLRFSRGGLFGSTTDRELLQAVRTLVALESQAAEQRANQPSTFDSNREIVQALNQSSNQQATAIAQNRQMITALEALRTQSGGRLSQNRLPASPEYNATLVTLQETSMAIHARTLRVQATALSNNRQTANTYAEMLRTQNDIRTLQADMLALQATSVALANDHTRLLEQICINTSNDTWARNNCR